MWDLPGSGIEHESPAWAGGFFTSETPGKPCSSTLAWRIPWTEELGRLQSLGSQGVGHDWSDLARIHVWGIREECSCFLTVHHIACRDECLGPKGLGLGSSLRRQEAPVARLAHLPVWPGHSGPLCTQPDEIRWRLKTLQAQSSSEPSCREFLSAETFLCPLFVTVGYAPESYLCFLLKKKLCKPMESFFPKGWEPRWELTVREDVGKMKIPT